MASLVLPLSGPIGLTEHHNDISTINGEVSSAGWYPSELTVNRPIVVKLRAKGGKWMRKIDLLVENAPPPPWLRSSIEAIGDLLLLPANWDLHQAPPIDLATIQAALDALCQIMQHGTLRPQWTPTPSGGVQLDWHDRMIDLEIVFEANEPEGFVVFSDQNNPIAEWHGSFMDNVDRLKALIEEKLDAGR